LTAFGKVLRHFGLLAPVACWSILAPAGKAICTMHRMNRNRHRRQPPGLYLVYSVHPCELWVSGRSFGCLAPSRDAFWLVYEPDFGYKM